jgi:hypothetical protein
MKDWSNLSVESIIVLACCALVIVGCLLDRLLKKRLPVLISLGKYMVLASVVVLGYYLAFHTTLTLVEDRLVHDAGLAHRQLIGVISGFGTAILGGILMIAGAALADD